MSLLTSFPQTRVEGELFAGFAAVFTILRECGARPANLNEAVLKALEAQKKYD